MKAAATIALFWGGGGLARYYLSGWVYALLGRTFPYGTFAVNVIGAYCIGLIMELSLRSTLIPATLNSASGTLRVAEGGVTAQAGATLRFGLDNADNSRLAAAGPIDLGGATLALELAPGFAPAAQHLR